MNGWHPATLGTHAGAERVEARRIGEQVVYRYRPGGHVRQAKSGQVAFERPAPWWYRLAARLIPGRCREIPEARNPDRVLLRQVAVVKRCAYLQSFASGEDPGWYHAHGRHLLVVGLWGGYTERRPRAGLRRLRAPYVYGMLPAELHQVTAPTPGHTSIAIMWGKGERFYRAAQGGSPRSWQEHTKVRVPRI